MKKLPLIISVVIVVAVAIVIFYKKPILDGIAQQKYASEIATLTQTIAEKKCEAGEEAYITLAQDYTYIKDFKKALSIYEDLSECYPGAYQVISDKYKLLLNNRAALYEDWGYHLKNTENDPRNSEKKYQEAVKIFKNIIQTFKNTDKINADEIK